MPLNIWNSMGIRMSPFFQEALDISETSSNPIKLFVGRQQENRDVLKRILGSNSNRIIIAGQPGTGKTSFIQYVKHQLANQHGFAVCSSHCRVPHNFSATELGVEILRSVVLSLKNALPSGKLEKLKGFKEARSLVEETDLRTWQLSLSAYGFGAGLGSEKKNQPPHFVPGQFYDALAQMTTAASTEGVTGIVVHLNNLENLEQDAKEAAFLLRDVRDSFLVSGLHFLLGATSEFYTSVVSAHAQVRSIFPEPISIKPMRFPEVKLLLERRYEYLQIEGMDFVPPVTWDLVEELHRIFLGDLRGMLSALEEACLSTLVVDPLSLNQALPYLAKYYMQQMTQTLSDAELVHLSRLANFSTDEFRQADVRKHLKISVGQVSKVFNQLERAQAIIRTKTQGRSQYYALSGRARLALGEMLS
ncbi:MAG: AAA family ATPase [Myxococcota bacterium]|nr:AAA family ATPase [Myxococcota bacterium]